MRLNNTTPVPNAFFDKHIGNMSGSAVRVYLKIVRNLLGWRDEFGKVKQRDWISHSQFEKTGLSNRSVTNGIQELLELKLIQTSDHIGNILSNPQQRKQAKRIYYSLILDNTENTALHNEKTKENHTQKMRFTKEISLPKYKAHERIPDHIRMKQILQQEAQKQRKRDDWS